MGFQREEGLLAGHVGYDLALAPAECPLAEEPMRLRGELIVPDHPISKELNGLELQLGLPGKLLFSLCLENMGPSCQEESIVSRPLDEVPRIVASRAASNYHSNRS